LRHCWRQAADDWAVHGDPQRVAADRHAFPPAAALLKSDPAIYPAQRRKLGGDLARRAVRWKDLEHKRIAG
jgi:hypothetical protein